MRQLIIATAAAVAALALASCDPKPLVVQDTRELKSATLKVNNDNSTWNAGESRFFTVEFAPDNALITDIRLEQNIEGMVEIENGERPDLFRVMARKAGRVKLTATVTDQNGITATDELTFNITGNYQPKMAIRLRRNNDPSNGKAFPKVMVCDAGQEFQIATLSDNANVKFRITHTDPETVSIEESSPSVWTLKALAPGNTKVTVTMTDQFGDKREKTYEVYVYGYAAFETQLDFSTLMLGLKVTDCCNTRSGCMLDVDGYFYGWPESYPNMRKSLMMNCLKDYIEVYEGADYPELVDEQYVIEEFVDYPPYNGKYYEAHSLAVKFTFEFDNPYIIVEDVVAKQPEDRDFTIRASFVQNGLEENEVVEDDEAEEIDFDSVTVDGWGNATEVVIPL